MNLQKTAQELKHQNDFLNSISKEEITFLIKACIFELENLQILSEKWPSFGRRVGDPLRDPK